MGMFDCVECHPSWQERFKCAKGHVLPNGRGWPDSWQTKGIPEGDCDGWVFELDANGIFWRAWKFDEQLDDPESPLEVMPPEKPESRVRSHMTVPDLDLCDTCEVCRASKDPSHVIVFLNVVNGQIEEWRVETV